MEEVQKASSHCSSSSAAAGPDLLPTPPPAETFSSPPAETFSSPPAVNHPSPPPAVGVENCYVFKSRLQEYAQKKGFLTPVYQTVKEGPSHDPVFKSTVIVDNVQYDSLPGFSNRKSAEQSAAEVALMEINRFSQMTESIPTVHETGLCKNLLQEFAQKMNYAIPSYVCNKQPSGNSPWICTVEIGGIQYIGAAARSKKEAEIKAARTAYLAIQRGCETTMNGASQYTVLPGKKKAKEPEKKAPETKKLKPKKNNFKKRWSNKRRFSQNKVELEGSESTDIVNGAANGEEMPKETTVSGVLRENDSGSDRIMNNRETVTELTN